MPNINAERWISLQEACEYLGVTRYTILKWITTKNMPAVKVGKLWKFKVNEIDVWIRKGGASE